MSRLPTTVICKWLIGICNNDPNHMAYTAAKRIEELEQQLQQAHRAGWEQAKREAVKLYCNECGQGCPRDVLCRDICGIANLEYKELTNE